MNSGKGKTLGINPRTQPKPFRRTKGIKVEIVRK